jgi:hypothetical protein
MSNTRRAKRKRRTPVDPLVTELANKRVTAVERNGQQLVSEPDEMASMVEAIDVLSELQTAGWQQNGWHRSKIDL